MNYSNYIIIGLGIFIILLIYVLYKYFKYKNVLVSKQISLKENNPPILNSGISNPYSTSFSYGVWIYVNSWSNNNKTIFYLANGSNVVSAINPPASGGTKPDFSVGLDKNSSKLYCTIGSSQALITNNFPIQKWAFVVVSLNENTLDCYLDGKLIVSKQTDFANFTDTIKKIGKDNIYLGDCDSSALNDIYLTQLKHWPYTLDPNTVWNLYLNGNGISQFGSNYNIDLSVSRDNTVQSQIRLF